MASLGAYKDLFFFFSFPLLGKKSINHAAACFLSPENETSLNNDAYLSFLFLVNYLESRAQIKWQSHVFSKPGEHTDLQMSTMWAEVHVF